MILFSVQCCYAVHWTDNNDSAAATVDDADAVLIIMFVLVDEVRDARSLEINTLITKSRTTYANFRHTGQNLFCLYHISSFIIAEISIQKHYAVLKILWRGLFSPRTVYAVLIVCSDARMFTETRLSVSSGR